MKKIVAITGGTKGIGRAIAERFLRDGFGVAVCSRSPRPKDLPAEIFHARVDVRSQNEVENFVVAAVKNFGRLDVFVNNAGISLWRPLENIDEKFAKEILETNVLGTLWGCAAAARVMGPGSAIVNISSLAGKRGSANNSVYCASKFAVNGITQALAKELGPRGIRVNAVCPVYVETATILEALKEKDSPAKGESVQKYLGDFAKSQTALGRLPTEEEVAQVVSFLAGPQAEAITGQCINVDCGTLPQ